MERGCYLERTVATHRKYGSVPYPGSPRSRNGFHTAVVGQLPVHGASLTWSDDRYGKGVHTIIKYPSAMKHLFLFLFTMLVSTLTGAQQRYSITINNGFFQPEYLVVEAGDEIEVLLTEDHTFTEVDAGTFRSGGVVPNGGIRIGRGIGYGFTGTGSDETIVTLHDTGDYFFVSEGRNGAVAKMHIVVIPSTHTGVSEAVDEFRRACSPTRPMTMCVLPPMSTWT